MNHICLSGRVGKDIDVFTTNNGKSYATTTLAVRRDKSTTDWFKLKIWGKTAEGFAQYIGKGDYVEVAGSMQSYKDKDGINRWEVNVNSWGFGSGKARNYGDEMTPKRTTEEQYFPTEIPW